MNLRRRTPGPRAPAVFGSEKHRSGRLLYIVPLLFTASACYAAHGLSAGAETDSGLPAAASPATSAVATTTSRDAGPPDAGSSCALAVDSVDPLCETPLYYWAGLDCVAGCCHGEACPVAYATPIECVEAHRGCVQPCGAALGAGCAPDEFCFFGGLECDWTGSFGVCAERPSTCAEIAPDPVCGCDLITYESACEAARNGTGVAYPGSCEPR